MIGAETTVEGVRVERGTPTGRGAADADRFGVCVTVTVQVPLLPESIDANTATGQFVVERDRYVNG